MGKIVIPYGDSAHVTCGILVHQLNGIFEYIPKEGDKLRFIVKHKGRVIFTQDTSPVEPYDKPLEIDLDLDLHEGKYIYDIKLYTDNDVYTIIKDKPLIID